jgi:hypothetical protein
MTEYTVEIQPDFLERQAKAQPIAAVAELIWNGLDESPCPQRYAATGRAQEAKRLCGARHLNYLGFCTCFMLYFSHD